MAVSFDKLNSRCLSAFSQEATYKDRLGAESTVSGIIESGVVLEDTPPGDASTYAKFWTTQSTFASGPELSETITVGTSVYKIFRKEPDAAGGLWLLLRYDHEVV